MMRVGVIGTGGMATWHARTATEIRGVRLTACCDVSEQVAEAYAKQWKIPAVYTDYTEMLEKENLDAVVNVTPDAVHCEVALAVLERGVHILSEKPLAASLEEAKKMAAAARKAGVMNMVNFSYRNSAGLQRAAQGTAAGEVHP